MTAAFYGVYVVVAFALVALAVVTLAWMLFAWRADDSSPPVEIPDDDHSRPSRLSFSLLVPARHEEAVLGQTIDHLARLDHDCYEVLVIVGHDDPGTEAVARLAARCHPDLVRVIVDEHAVKNKPRALNTALPRCRGEVVGVFDAEDVVQPGLLQAVESRLLLDRSAAVQSGVQLMNFWSSWYAVRNVLEYYFWFRSRLHFQAERGFIPLGGNTVFVRRGLLELLGGWDGDCLAEDCDLGVRLSSHGYSVSVMYDPLLVTREEVPSTLGAFVRQRTRWSQGFLQVLAKGDWRLLPHRHRRVLAVLTLCTPFAQAATGVLLPFALLGVAALTMPVGVVLITFLPIIPTAITLLVEHVALHEFGQTFGRRPRPIDHLRLALGMPVFQALLAYAALRAVLRQAVGENGWEKTTHLGLHHETPRSSLEQGRQGADVGAATS